MTVPSRVHFTSAERIQALNVGAAALQAAFPRLRATIRVVQGPNVLDAAAGFGWPGVVLVTLRYTGQVVAQSLPGKPEALDDGAMVAVYRAALRDLADDINGQCL